MTKPIFTRCLNREWCNAAARFTPRTAVFIAIARQLRPDYVSADLDRERDAGPSPRPKWGSRRSAPRDYVFERPLLLGEERLGPDLADLGKAAPSTGRRRCGASRQRAAGIARNSCPIAFDCGETGSESSGCGFSSRASYRCRCESFSQPRTRVEIPPRILRPGIIAIFIRPQTMSAENRDSIMPAFRFLYERRRIGSERSADALQLERNRCAAERLGDCSKL